MIEFCNVMKWFLDGIFVVDDFSFVLLLCKIMVFVGLFGCGKMILLCMINCMVEFILGEVEIDGESVFGGDLVVLCCWIGYVM